MIAACVLAAGASSRFGSSKQLETIDGESWVRRTARLASEAGCSRVLVVTGADGDRVAAEVNDLAGAVVVHHEGWESGMGSSIAAGARALAGHESCRGVLLLTCDLPALDVTILKKLIKAFEGEPRRIVCCAYAGTVGIPVLFGSDWFDRLARFDGDRGAKALLLEHPGRRIDIEWPPGAADRDRREGGG